MLIISASEASVFISTLVFGQGAEIVSGNLSAPGSPFGESRISHTEGGETYTMTKFQKQLLSILATGSLMLNATGPVFAVNGSNFTISDNASGSENEIEYEVENETTVTQSNIANVTNTVKSTSDTGGNKVNKNNGGDVELLTGDATSKVSIENLLNKNSAVINCCDLSDLSIKIARNAADSDNEIEVEVENETTVEQSNEANVTNDVDADAKTGDNQANKNNGGDVTLLSGDAKSITLLSTVANANSAQVGKGLGQGGSLSAMILDSGADAESEIEIDLDLETKVFQDNDAHVSNEVDADAKTGKNSTNKNNGGDVVIGDGGWGDATTIVGIDNMLNFNWADVNCCGLLDVTAKIAGNAADSENEIEVELDSDLDVVQGGKDGGNNADVKNDVDADAKTGKNKANKNNGGEVSVTSGDADVLVGIDNLLNFNYANVECCLEGFNAVISDNGADSENEIEVEKDSDRGTWQDNFARLLNELYVDGLTGDNKVNENNDGGTGDPSVTTGDATTVSSVANTGNVNQEGGELDLSDVEFEFDVTHLWTTIWFSFFGQTN